MSKQFTFPSPEWVEAFAQAVNANEKYGASAKKWTHGPVSLICSAEVAVGIEKDVGIWLDLHEGVCREARMMSADEARTAPFCITGRYHRWKQVINRELDPIKGMMQGKLKLKGSLPTVVRFVRASQELVKSAGQVPTDFLG